MTRFSRTAMLLLPLVLTSSGCPDPGSPETDVEHFSVTVKRLQILDDSGQWVVQDLSEIEEGSPLPYRARTKVDIEVRALPDDGGFDGYVRVAVVPGEVMEVTSEEGEMINARTGFRVTSGEPMTASVELVGGFGDTRLLVEDVGHDPGPPVQARCDDGIDNDGDGRVDFPDDPGCYLRNDQSEQPGAHAIGVSEPVWFYNPRLSHVQGCSLTPDLERQSITVDRGGLYVTAVTVDGFYVSDYPFVNGGCDPTSGCCDGGRFAHIFAFNFNTPRGMRVCDRLDWVGGIVGDFYGFTELNFPSWERYDIDQDPSNGLTLMRKEPSEITADDCPLESVELQPEMIPNRRLMETFEAALVHVTDAELPTEWVNCDFNGNGEVAYTAAYDEVSPFEEVILDDELVDIYCPSFSEGVCSEVDCNDACVERNCAELTNYREHGQYPVIIDGQPILVVTSSNVPDFNPYRRAINSDGPVRLDRIGGVLKEFGPLDTPWIIEPRCHQDLFIADDECEEGDRVCFRAVVPIYQRCVPSEETGDYEDPY